MSEDPVAAAHHLMTVDEYFRTPETVLPAELKYGILHVSDAPTPNHQSVVAQFFVALRAHVIERQLGRVWLSPLDVVLDHRKALIVQPDLMFISNARSWIVQDRVWGAPELVIEVLSPNPRIGRTDEHLRWFAEYGVHECWLVHQDQHRISIVGFEDGQISTRRLIGRREPIVSSVLPEFSMSLQQILEV
jgi:Uma2 family endonuclease